MISLVQYLNVKYSKYNESSGLSLSSHLITKTVSDKYTFCSYVVMCMELIAFNSVLQTFAFAEETMFLGVLDTLRPIYIAHSVYLKLLLNGS